MCLNFNKLNIKLLLVLLAFLFMIFNVKIALSQDNMPDFPYDPEVQASKAKVCAIIPSVGAEYIPYIGMTDFLPP